MQTQQQRLPPLSRFQPGTAHLQSPPTNTSSSPVLHLEVPGVRGSAEVPSVEGSRPPPDPRFPVCPFPIHSPPCQGSGIQATGLAACNLSLVLGEGLTRPHPFLRRCCDLVVARRKGVVSFFFSAQSLICPLFVVYFSKVSMSSACTVLHCPVLSPQCPAMSKHCTTLSFTVHELSQH